VQGDAAVGVARSRQDAGADRVEDLVIVELAVNARRRGVGDGAGDLGSGQVPALRGSDL
jgi:hypothetical protein